MRASSNNSASYRERIGIDPRLPHGYDMTEDPGLYRRQDALCGINSGPRASQVPWEMELLRLLEDGRHEADTWP
jgi:hypothetical protein